MRPSRSRKLLLVAFAGVVGCAIAVQAAGAQTSGGAVATVVAAGPDGLRVRTAPSAEANTSGRLATGSTIRGACLVEGQAIAGPRGNTTAWLRLADGSYVSAAYLRWSNNGPASCDAAPARRPATTDSTRAVPAARPATTPPATTALAPGALAADLASTVAGQPVTTRSWYLRTVEAEVLHQAGCVTGRAHRDAPGTQSGAVVLSFGGTVTSGAGWAFDLYGKTRVNEQAVGDAVLAYLGGYLDCTDATSTLTVGLGTTTSVGETSGRSAAAFAGIAERVSARARARTARATVLGANDIELGYVGPSQARAWVDAYRANTDLGLVYFGDAAGCPPDRVPEGDDCGSREHPEWTAEDTWYVTSRPGTVIMPGNYVTDGVQARQWRSLSRYAVEHHGQPLRFLGVLSQRGACRTRPCTERVRNDSGASWQQLSSALGSVPLQVSDIAWLGE